MYLDDMKCECNVCKLSHRIKELLKKLPHDILDEATTLFDDLWEEMESDSTDLGVLNSKITGKWPNELDNGKNYTRINGELYEIHSTKVEENEQKEKSNIRG